MKELLINEIRTQMSDVLSEWQMNKLHEVLLTCFNGITVENTNNHVPQNESIDYLNKYLGAKKLEGCSAKTLFYYQSTIEKMLLTIDKNIREIATDDLRCYLSNYHSENQTSMVTIDNIRRILSGFFAWLEDENYIIKSPARRIHKVKTAQLIKETFSDENQTAQSLSNFNKENGNAFNKIKCKMNSFEYKILSNKNNKPLLCEKLKFSDLQSFIYYDFFNGLKRKYIPNKCKNCEAYFLIPSGRYISYCNQPLENDKNKTCRDIGAKRRYDDKCKNDPIWQAYNRAYKAHYARYMKKKMTTAEFEQWSRYAVELRTQAEANKITLNDFLRLIKI